LPNRYESHLPVVIEGLGTRLLQLLVDIGRQEGLQRIFGLILPENYSMLQIAKKVGFLIVWRP
jgi:acetyltransferase